MDYFRLYLLLLMSLFLAGCGSSLENFVMTTGGDATEATPAGVVINSGTGPVLDGEDAFLRVSSQYLGLNVPNRAVRARAGAAVVGTQTDPLLNLYQLAETAIPRGAVVGPSSRNGKYCTLSVGYP